MPEITSIYHYKDNTLYMIYYLILDIIWAVIEMISVIVSFMKKMECMIQLNLTQT